MPFCARLLSAVDITPVSDAELTFTNYTINSVIIGGHEL
jgi:hypothetical protein